MSLANDLLHQADLLAGLDPRRPKQANLRRATSAAYYALFHLLTAEAARMSATESGLAARLGRSYTHGEMKKVSGMVALDRLPKAILPGRTGYTAPPDLKLVANTFVTLQQARHEADYDVTRVFLRREVREFVYQSREAFTAWDRVKKSDDARLYLACFLLWDRWDKDPR